MRNAELVVEVLINSDPRRELSADDADYTDGTIYGFNLATSFVMRRFVLFFICVICVVCGER